VVGEQFFAVRAIPMLVAWSDHVARETSLSWPNLYSDWAIRRRRRFVRFLGNFALTRGGDGCLCEVKGVGAPPNPYNVFLMHARARLIGSSQRLGYSTRLMRYNLKTFSSRLSATVTFLVGATLDCNHFQFLCQLDPGSGSSKHPSFYSNERF